jgi:NTP pyrophosphatase (non-canonical NTP hydrolase)
MVGGIIMDMHEYEEKASTYAMYKDPMYPIYALIEEIGEVYRLFGKFLRDGLVYDKITLEKELGDVLWNLTQIANDNNISLADMAETNLKKLESRKQRGVLQGSGDER